MKTYQIAFFTCLFAVSFWAKSQVPPPPPPPAQEHSKISRADSLRNEGNITEAISLYRKIYEINPNDYTSVYNYACALSIGRHPDSAFRYLAIATKLNPSIAPLTDPDLVYIRNDDKWTGFENDLISMISDDSSNPIKDIDYARILWRLKCMDQFGFYETGIAVRKLGPDSPVVSALRWLQTIIRDKNLEELETLLKERGWPGKSQVGSEASEAAFYVLQHSNAEAQKNYIGMFEKACMEKEANWQQYALMFDRMRMNQNKPQRYGTHTYLDPAAGKMNELYPLEDENMVNEWRQEIGLEPLKSFVPDSKNSSDHGHEKSFIYSKTELEQMMTKPACMGEYLPSQAGPLRKPDGKGGFTYDSTFTVEKIRIKSEGYLITGWLYLPLGEKKCPLVVLTCGGGNVVRAIRSFPDFMAPVLAHCGYAAFVHDKRGTGESEGNFVNTTYDDYITDAGNCALYLAKHNRIDPERIGVMGASEGGRIAVVAASRYPVFRFVISQAGTMVNAIDDRMYAQINGMIDQGILPDSVAVLISPVWRRSFEAWASKDPQEHKKINAEIMQMREIYPRSYLPFTKSEMDSISGFEIILPTWNSLGADYMSEMKHFTKKWLAIFGAEDRVVPTYESSSNITSYMKQSGNNNYNIAIIPGMGHVPVDIETKRRIDFDYLIINWLNKNVLVD